MEPFLLVLAFAALPVLGNYAGGWLAERVAVSERRLSLALHVAAGVIVGVVAIELMPAALGVGAPWLILAAFVGGALFFLGLDHMTEHVQRRFGRPVTGARPGLGKGKGASSRVLGGASLAVFLGVALDLFSDGVMIGAGSSLDPGLGLLLALGQVPADVPEGFATIATLRREGVPKGRRRLLLLALAAPILLGAMLGFFALRGASEAAKMAVLAFTAGALLTLVVEEVVPEAHQEREGRLAALLFVGGFAMFYVLSTLFETG